MLFNSLQFFVFFIIVTIWYFQLPHKFRWFLLLVASCYFYMSFVPVYILILGGTIIIDYFAGIYLEKIQGNKKRYFLIISLIANVGILAVFKYYNFLNFNIAKLASLFSSTTPLPYLEILLPIGLSFHTFQAMSYTIEVYRGNQKAEKHFGIYALYVMFYPQLVAGPIERPQNVLHQFHEKHAFDLEKLKLGLMQMAWGFFKKMVIADRLAIAVDSAYTDPQHQSGLTLLFATFFYSFQIYCDFSGYSDIGIGAAKCMGFDLMKNFNSPYLSTTISDFWRKWHISLSSWFKDYLYIPLGGNRVNKYRAMFNLFFVFLISGLWHGANWTFIIWGALHGIFLVVENAFRKNVKLAESASLNFITLLKGALVFTLVSFAWIFFRSPNLSTANIVIKRIANLNIHDKIDLQLNTQEIAFSLLLILTLLYKEKVYPSFLIKNNYIWTIVISVTLFSCYIFGVFGNKQFIYFQF